MTHTQDTKWYGYRRMDFTFEGREAIMVFPEGGGNGQWICKIEYFDAFQDLERDLVARGYHLAFLKNDNRWASADVIARRARFVDYVADTFGLERRFAAIGMSCGGLLAVKFAAYHPDKVSVLYLDAPVMNFLSCPMGFGQGEPLGEQGAGWQELQAAYGFSLAELLAYREHPIDLIPRLVAARIPVALVYGDSDRIVPYEENGAWLERAYRAAGVPLFVQGKIGCDHHPHGLHDRTALIDFICAHT